MPANGVIGITAQILESADLGGKEKPTPDMSMLQRISQSFNNMRKDWKKMVGGKATGLFWVMLANSKIIQTVIGTTLTMRATGVNTLFGTNTTLYATLTVTGRDSGARLQIPVQINKAAQTTA